MSKATNSDSGRKFQSVEEILDFYMPDFQSRQKSLEERTEENMDRLISQFQESLKAGLKKIKDEKRRQKNSE